MSLVPTAIARETALAAMACATPEAIIHLRSVAEKGGMAGRYFAGCFYGTLAKGSGVKISEDGPLPFETVRDFARTLGVELEENHPDRVEDFVFGVLPHHTLFTNPTLASIAMWCDEALIQKGIVSYSPPLRKYDDEKWSPGRMTGPFEIPSSIDPLTETHGRESMPGLLRGR